jgi:hypothetical protein
MVNGSSLQSPPQGKADHIRESGNFAGCLLAVLDELVSIGQFALSLTYCTLQFF